MSNLLRSRRAKAVAAIATAGLSLTALVATGNPSGADPKQLSANAIRGTGSDTTQDILGALAGEANGHLYDPARSSQASGYEQLISFDATGSACISTRAPGASVDRPNGSGAGVTLLSRAINNVQHPTPNCGGGTKTVSGLVQFARSSSGPASGSGLTYVPFGVDAVGFAYYANGVTPVTTLTTQQLTDLYHDGPQNIGGVDIIPCPIQPNSGTYRFWLSKLGYPDAQSSTQLPEVVAATADCGAALQENDANALATRGAQSQFAGKQLVIGFSAANFVAQTNGVAASQIPPGGVVDLGAIDALGKPYTGNITAPPIAPASGFYGSTYGRTVYNVVSSSLLALPGNNHIKTMFVGPTSGVCSASGTISDFGFLPATNCGVTTITGGFSGV
ncbi:MAG: hypothetical protein AB7L84_06005 [Acidimicrobiia bacterium]